jgi:hypothetical protein
MRTGDDTQGSAHGADGPRHSAGSDTLLGKCPDTAPAGAASTALIEPETPAVVVATAVWARA